MSERLVEVVAVNLAERIMARADETLGDIRRLLDAAFDDTDDLDVARVAIVEWRDGTWSPVELHEQRRLS